MHLQHNDQAKSCGIASGQAVRLHETVLARRDDIFKEIDILCDLTHENVIFMKEYFEENNKVSALP